MLLLLFAAHQSPVHSGALQAGAILWFLGVGVLKVLLDLRSRLSRGSEAPIAAIRLAGDDHPVKLLYPENSGLNDYTKRHHHSDGQGVTTLEA